VEHACPCCARRRRDHLRCARRHWHVLTRDLDHERHAEALRAAQAAAGSSKPSAAIVECSPSILILGSTMPGSLRARARRRGSRTARAERPKPGLRARRAEPDRFEPYELGGRSRIDLSHRGGRARSGVEDGGGRHGAWILIVFPPKSFPNVSKVSKRFWKRFRKRSGECMQYGNLGND